jgi:polyhydroxyalkanoate synthesis repressor PhaR
MGETRTIKKYPNRRLYDTALSKYITLDDVRRLVLEGADFQVIDAKTEEDITRSILLQVILEQEEDGKPILSTKALTQLIRFYGDAVQGLASDFLERSLAILSEQRQFFEQQVRSASTYNPFTTWAELTQRNLDAWQQMQRSFFEAAAAARRPGVPSPGQPSGPTKGNNT